MLVGVSAMSYLTMAAVTIGEEYDMNPKLGMSTSNCSGMESLLNSTTPISNTTSKLSIDEL